MPDVRVTNPEVKIDLNDKETTTVPSGERWMVDLTRNGQDVVKLRNPANNHMLESSANRLTRVRLSEGDIVMAGNSTKVGVRGDVIST